jgi:outer membrane protein TolC
MKQTHRHRLIWLACLCLPFLLLGEEPLLITLEKGINLAVNAKRRLAAPLDAITQSQINLEFAESDFDFKIVPKIDTGYGGGGRVGEGLTVGAGVELSQRFWPGTRLALRPSTLKAADHHESNFQVILSQPLLRGFGREYSRAGILAAEYGNRSAMRSFYLAEVRLIQQTIQGLYEIAKQEAFVALEKEAVERIRKLCRGTKAKEKIGFCDPLDANRADTELKSAEDSLNQALDRLQDAKDNLRNTLALPLDLPVEVDVPITYEPVKISLDEATTIALGHRIELVQAQDQVRESMRLCRLAKNNLWPDVNLVLDYTSFARDEIFTRAFTRRRQNRWGLGVTTSGDIDNVSGTANFDRALMATEDAKRNVEQVHDNIILDVRRALRALNRALEKIDVQEEQIQNAFNGFHLANLKFVHGLANNFDLVQAEKNLRSAQTSYIAAIIEYKVGEFNLLISLGTLADKPCIPG